MKNKTHFLFIRLIFVYAFLLLLILFTALRSEITVKAAKDALFLCAFSIIPSLFPFFVFSACLINSGFAQFLKKPAAYIMRPLFNVSGSGALAFITGILSGYPSGAHTVRMLFKKNLISRTEAERLLPFCNNSGPLFITGAVGAAFFGSKKAGIFLYLIHIISAVLVGFAMRFYKRGEKTSQKTDSFKNTLYTGSFSDIFTKSIESSVSAILNVCGFIVIFAVLSAALSENLSLFVKNENLRLLLTGILEITVGISGVSASSLSFSDKLIFTSFLLGVSGICVTLQVASAVREENLSMKTYIFGKILHGVFSAALCAFFLKFTSISTGALPQNTPNMPLLAVFYGISLIFLLSFAFIRIKKRKLFFK